MSFHTSLTGLNAASTQLSVTSNNIANVGTTGFKRSHADFGDIFSSSALQKASTVVGQGVALNGVFQEFTQGNVNGTGNALDLAINGDGFFPLKSADGLKSIYTRNGGFMLNDDNHVVNSNGLRLMAAPVDSAGKAELGQLGVLTVQPRTLGQARETMEIELSLNLPATAPVIDTSFNRNDPSTYNESTALTVYDSGGNSYLATVYYVKTQAPSQTSPESKWQTHVFIGDTEVKPALQTSVDEAGNAMYVNKYGEVLPRTDPRVIPSGGLTEMYTLDDLTDLQPSQPAVAVGNTISPTLFDGTHLVFSETPALTFNLAVDGTSIDVIDFTPAAERFQDPLNRTQIAPQVLADALEVELNNLFGANDPPRYGIGVDFDAASQCFSIRSGTTGDGSSILFSTDDAVMAGLFGIEPGAPLETAASPETALRGQPSSPATLTSAPLMLSASQDVAVTANNARFFVTVDGISGSVELDSPATMSVDELAAELQTRINALTDADGRQVQGVSVRFDATSRQFVFTTGTTGDRASILVSGAADWGLNATTAAFGQTSEWTRLKQHAEDGQLQFVSNGEQTADPTGLNTDTAWWPLYLDRGELSFDISGQLLSPPAPMRFGSTLLNGGQGALNLQIDLSRSTQYSTPFTVLSQSQDGLPEGELMGLDVAEDGLVRASYSNGTQAALGKIVLANFADPNGLLQIGDASYVASGAAGAIRLGEANSTGYGSLRAGATEGANVDLTRELVDLITAQRNFQANAKAIETATAMTQAIINVRS